MSTTHEDAADTPVRQRVRLLAVGGKVLIFGSPDGLPYWHQPTQLLPRYTRVAYSLAATFPLADRWFGSLLGQTQPNRRYLLAGTSVGMVNDVTPENLLPAPGGTIVDRLDRHRISWRNYYSSFPPTSYLFVGEAVRDHSGVVPTAQFFADAKSGDLPGFAIIDPDFHSSSGENPQNIVHAEVSPPRWCRR